MGVPVGSDLEADEVTMHKAMEGAGRYSSPW